MRTAASGRARTMIMTDAGTLEDQRVLVTGAGGFVGRHAVGTLMTHGARIRAMLGPPGSQFMCPDGVEAAFEADICDEPFVRDLIRDTGIVVHLAGPPSVAQSFIDPGAFERIHVHGTAVVANAVLHAGPRRLVYVSSAEVYGRSGNTFINESQPLDARSPYAACKIAAERSLHVLAEAGGHVVIILRPFSLYGPGAPAASLLAQLLGQVSSRRPLTLNDPRPVRDFCFITDVAEAIQRACEVPLSPGIYYFNIGTMRGTSTGQLARMVLAAAESDLPLLVSPMAGRPAGAEIFRLVADNTRAAAGLGWEPRIRLEDGLRKLLAEAA